MNRATASLTLAACGLLAITTPAPGRAPKQVLQGHRSGVFSVAFSPDGKVLLSGSRDGTVVAWNVADGTQRSSHPVQKFDVNAIAISQDGRWAAAGGAGNDVVTYDVQKQGFGHTLHGPEKAVEALVFNRAGTVLVGAALDGSIRAWDVRTGEQLLVFRGHQQDGKAKPVKALAFNPDGTILATGGADGFIRLWDVKAGEQKAAHSTVVTVDSVAFSPDGARVAAVGGPGRKVHVWDVKSGHEVLTLQGHTDGVTVVRYSPDGKWIASAGRDNSVRLWDAATGKAGPVLEGHQQNVYCLAFSPDGKTLASGSGDRTIRLWDVSGAR